jgi:hypothetical protein
VCVLGKCGVKDASYRSVACSPRPRGACVLEKLGVKDASYRSAACWPRPRGVCTGTRCKGR